jgi:hypothetical protein
LDQQHGRVGDVPGFDDIDVVLVLGGADSGGDSVTTSVNGVNGSAHPAGTNGAARPVAAGGTVTAPPVARSPLPTRQRRPGYLALGALLVLGLGGAFGYLYSTAGEKVPVVVVTQPVAVGEVIERGDLSTVDVAGDLTAIAGANLSSVVGQRAAVALLPDMLLQRSMVTAADPLPAGQVQVGVAVKGGQLPADGLVPGDRVQVLALPATQQSTTGGDAGKPLVLVESAAVFAAHPDPVQAGGTLLTLLVPAADGPAVAAASASGSAALVKVPTP